MFGKAKERYDISMLDHHATNASGETLLGFIRAENESLYLLFEKGNPRPIGYIDFDVIEKKDKKIVMINDMENYNRSIAMGNYKGIGALLHEFVIYKASQLKKVDGLQLAVAYHSHAFHYRCGFRFSNQKENALLKKDLKGEHLESDKHLFPQSMSMPESTLEIKMEKYKAHSDRFEI